MMFFGTYVVVTLRMMDERNNPLAVFRRRLDEAVSRSGLSKSEFAELAGIDRTTLSQLLSPANRRLPRFDTIVSLAATHRLSTDWLVGLSNAGPVEAEMMSHTSFTAPGPTESDERLLEWLEEAADYKVRYVPATLPDLLKTDTVIRHERSGGAGPDPSQTMETSAARLAWARNPDSEMECCSSMQIVTSFARGEGVFRRLGVAARCEQLDRMIELTGELYPMFRWFMFDGLQRYAAPLTIFGHRRAALYLGQMYLVLTSAEHVRTLSRHFDGLIRDATVQPHQIPTHLSRLRRELDR
jgi:transcriptional regulator with XRE-family HTH domain